MLRRGVSVAGGNSQPAGAEVSGTLDVMGFVLNNVSQKSLFLSSVAGIQ